MTKSQTQPMFHVKRHPALLVGLALLALLLSSGCVSAASARGWAQPVQFGSGSDAVVIVSPKGGKLDGIDPTTGDRRWRFPDDWAIWQKDAEKVGGIYGQPQVAGGTVFIAGYNGWVYAFKPPSRTSGRPGEAVGLFKLKGNVVGGLALDGDLLYVTTDDGLLYALNATDIQNRTASSNNVRQAFLFEAGDRIWTPPVLSGGRVYFGTTDGHLFALDARSGAEAWRFQAGAALVSTPVVSGDTVLAGGFDRRLYAVDASTGRQKWTFDATDWIWSKPLVDGGRVYIADFNGKVFALSLSDGRAVWDAPFDAGGSVRSALALSGGNLIVVNEDGDLYGVSTAGGQQVWGPVRVGTTVHADLLTSGSTLFVAPSRCTSDETGKLYYYKVDAATQTRQSTGSVC